jgi:hypothetical protein
LITCQITLVILKIIGNNQKYRLIFKLHLKIK